MNEKILLRIVFTLLVFGLFILLFLSSSLTIDATDIGKIDGNSQKAVKIYGTVTSVHTAGNLQIIEVAQREFIEVLVGTNSIIRKGDLIEVIGRVEGYNGKDQIIADRIRVVSIDGRQ